MKNVPGFSQDFHRRFAQGGLVPHANFRTPRMPLWIVIFVTALVFTTFIYSLFHMQDRSNEGRAVKYRDRFERLINDLEALVLRANRLYEKAFHTKDALILEHYHSAIKMIETLLMAVKNLRAFSSDIDALVAPLFLVKDIDERLLKIETAMEHSKQGKPHEFLRAAPVMAHAVIGCHFCSRPFEASLFGKVRVKLDGRSEEVAACVYCREKLLSTRKAKVLFFNEDGEQVHWSRAKSWTPSPEYWNINRDEFAERGKSPHLELVYSNVSRLHESQQKND